MSSFLANLSWRRAFRNFNDSDEDKTNSDVINPILDAIVLAPSSFGLQPYCVYVIQNRSIRQKLYSLSFSQKHVVSCNTLLVFCARTDVLRRVDEFVSQTGSELKALILNFLATFPNLKEWATRQVYIALGFALAAAAELKIHTCPMEGFVPTEVKKMLELPENVDPVVYLAIDGSQISSSEGDNDIKFRFPREDIIRELQ